jgi:hypothetical protein
MYINQKGMTTAKDIFFVDSFFLDTQNNVNIDYVEAIKRLLQCNVDPFVSNTPNLLFSCLDTVSKNPDIPFDNLPSRMLLYIVYFQQLKKIIDKTKKSLF